MGQDSKIEWTDHTFNPWIGCAHVSPGCDHCYAEALAKRYGWAEWGVGKERRRTSPPNWRKPLAWDRDAAVNLTRRRVFCASLADVFDNDVPDAWRSELFGLIEDTEHLDWLLLTKRIGNVPKMVPSDWMRDGFNSNVWLGISVVNQIEANRDIHKLMDVPARVRFLSCEPLIGPVSLYPKVDWVIVGGESGPGARDMDADWARAIRDECKAAGVAFFMKQMTKKAPIPDDLMVREFPA